MLETLPLTNIRERCYCEKRQCAITLGAAAENCRQSFLRINIEFYNSEMMNA